VTPNFRVPPNIPGMGKATYVKFGRPIHRDRLKMSVITFSKKGRSPAGHVTPKIFIVPNLSGAGKARIVKKIYAFSHHLFMIFAVFDVSALLDPRAEFFYGQTPSDTFFRQERQGYEALTAARETKYKSICKGKRKYNKKT